MTRNAPLFALAVVAAAALSACSREPAPTPTAAAAPAAPAAASTPDAAPSPGASTASATATATVAAVRADHAEINGVNYYYEVHGTGEPLLLLHGGLGSGQMFAPVLPAIGKDRQLIVVDLHGHGRTPLGQRPMSLIDQGDDMAALVAKLGHAQVDVLGYSLGAGVALRLAIQHPDRVRRAVLVSGSYSDAGFYPEIRAQQKQVDAGALEMMKQTPMYQQYVAIAPKDEFGALLDAIGGLMKQSVDWSADLPKVTMPVMLVYGDGDMYTPEYIVGFYQKLGGGQRDGGWMGENLGHNRLAILPGRVHYDLFMAPEMVAVARPFLDGRTGSAAAK